MFTCGGSLLSNGASNPVTQSPNPRPRSTQNSVHTHGIKNPKPIFKDSVLMTQNDVDYNFTRMQLKRLQFLLERNSWWRKRALVLLAAPGSGFLAVQQLCNSAHSSTAPLYLCLCNSAHFLPTKPTVPIVLTVSNVPTVPVQPAHILYPLYQLVMYSQGLIGEV